MTAGAQSSEDEQQMRAAKVTISDVMFIADVSGGTADVETVSVAYLVRDGDGGAPVIVIRGLRYHDRMVRREGRWLVAQRVHVPEWMHEVARQPV